MTPRWVYYVSDATGVIEYYSSRFVVRIDDDCFELSQWFDRLTDDQKDEIAILDFEAGTSIIGDLVGVVKDWIEDHGGDRDWWKHFVSRERK